jgi:succinyl-CoA synthetase alpha subunit
MGILIDKNTRLLVHGITGRQGMFHTEKMLEYGTKVVGGVTPGKGGQWVQGVPVFNTAANAVKATDANCSMVSVPARFAADSMYEAADAGVPLSLACRQGPARARGPTRIPGAVSVACSQTSGIP